MVQGDQRPQVGSDRLHTVEAGGLRRLLLLRLRRIGVRRVLLQVAIRADLMLRLKQRMSTAWERMSLQGDDELSDRLWAQLVDLLVEGMLLDLRGEVLEGRCDRTTYAHQLIDLTDRCRRAGLLPLGRRRR